MEPATNATPLDFPGPRSQRLGIASADAVAAIGLAYLAVLAIGFATLPAPDRPIIDPWFTALELLILAEAPAIVLLMASLLAAVPPDRKSFALLALAFATITATLTTAVHSAILLLARHPALADADGLRRALSFEWPSAAYVLDVLAWDFWFALAAGVAAIALPSRPGLRIARGLLAGSAALAAAGLSGAATGDMALRNVGILGYGVMFPMAAFALGRAFRRASASTGPGDTPLR